MCGISLAQIFEVFFFTIFYLRWTRYRYLQWEARILKLDETRQESRKRRCEASAVVGERKSYVADYTEGNFS